MIKKSTQVSAIAFAVATLLYIGSADLTAAQAATYYVDFDSGNDSNNGLSPTTAWKHSPGDTNAVGVPKIKASNHSTAALTAGDTVLFKGGVSYQGNIELFGLSGAPGNPITLKGTGWGAGQAIIEGADTFKPMWAQCMSAEQCGGNPNFAHIYYATAPATYTDFRTGFYEDGAFLWYAQGPQAPDPFYWDTPLAFHHVPKASPTAFITANSVTDPTVLTQPATTAWTGSYVGVFVYPNVTYVQKTTNYNPSTHTISFTPLVAPNVPYDHTKSDQYYTMLNDLSLLNQPGHYVFNDSTHVMYVWPRASDNPNKHVYSISARNVAIWLNQTNHVVVEGFLVQHSLQGITTASGKTSLITDVTIRNNEITTLNSNNWYAISAGGDHVVIENNTVKDILRGIGIVTGGTDLVVNNNTVHRASRQGIWFMGASNGQITHNTVDGILGDHSNGISVYAGGSDNLVAHNVITNCLTPITVERSNNLTLYNNYVDAGGRGNTFDNWGNMTGRLTIINNTFINNSRHMGIDLAVDASIKTILNNVIDGGGLTPATAPNYEDYNVFTNLDWAQKPSMLAHHEILQTNMSSIFVGGVGTKLLSGGPGVGKGTNPMNYLPVAQFPAYNFMVDLNGVPRSGANWDIGAYALPVVSASTSGPNTNRGPNNVVLRNQIKQPISAYGSSLTQHAAQAQ